MKRRAFIAGLGGTLVLPLAARAQQQTMPLVGSLFPTGHVADSFAEAAFRNGLNEAGYFDGKNARIETRWAENKAERLPALAADLVSRHVTVIFAGGNQPALAAKAATATIPIVFVTGGDPVKLGLVASLNRPGGNLTGVVFLTQLLESKRLGLLHDMVPQANRIAALLNPNNPIADTQVREIDEAAHALGLQLQIQYASTERDIDTAFATIAQARAGGLLVGADPFFFNKRANIIAQAEHYRLPAMYEWREFPVAGGLMSYGTSLTGAYRHAGVYTGQILKGANPADLPVQQATKFELVINLKTAKALGLTIPPTLLARADEVIE
jgi:putative tryptophan/tyrosine transport system substrate-binding protein